MGPDLRAEIGDRNGTPVVQVLLDAREIRGVFAAVYQPDCIEPLVGSFELCVRSDVKGDGVSTAGDLPNLERFNKWLPLPVRFSTKPAAFNYRIWLVTFMDYDLDTGAASTPAVE